MPTQKSKNQSPSHKGPTLEPVGEPVSDAMELFRKAAISWDKYIQNGSKPPPEVVRELYHMAEFVLRAYCRPKNWVDPNGPPREFLPLKFARLVANQAGYLAKGILPAPMHDAIAKNRPAAGPHETNDLVLAVAYIAAEKEHLVVDKTPIKTVAAAYDVDRSTVHRWRRSLDWVTPNHFFPDGDDGERGKLLTESMLAAAQRYRIAGRSAGAVTRRDRKRPST